MSCGAKIKVLVCEHALPSCWPYPLDVYRSAGSPTTKPLIPILSYRITYPDKGYEITVTFLKFPGFPEILVGQLQMSCLFPPDSMNLQPGFPDSMNLQTGFPDSMNLQTGFLENLNIL